MGQAQAAAAAGGSERCMAATDGGVGGGCCYCDGYRDGFSYDVVIVIVNLVTMVMVDGNVYSFMLGRC